MTAPSFASVDFEEVLGRLIMHAKNLSTALVCHGLREKVVAGGDSASDFAQSTLLKLLDPLDMSVNWSADKGPPTTAGVIAYLRAVLTRDFLDLKKSSRYKKTIYPELPGSEDPTGDDGFTLDDMAGSLETPEGLRQKQERVDWILKQFEGEPKLREIAKLQLAPEGYNAFSNQELAELLDLPVKEVENHKKRFKRALRNLAAAQNAERAKHDEAKN